MLVGLWLHARKGVFEALMWLEVSEELSIVAKSIVAVEAIDEINSMVYTDGRTFKVMMPKSVLMNMIESRVKGQSSMSNVERLLTQIYQGQVSPRP
jgi:hypothetical protein